MTAVLVMLFKNERNRKKILPMDIIYLLKVLIRRKWTIMFCLVLGLTRGIYLQTSHAAAICIHRPVFNRIFPNAESKSAVKRNIRC